MWPEVFADVPVWPEGRKHCYTLLHFVRHGHRVFPRWPEYSKEKAVSVDKPRHHIKNGPSSQSYGFSCSQVRMWELDLKEGWAPKNLCFQTVVLEKTIESPLDCKEIKPVNSKGNQSWIIIGRTDAKAKAPKLWPPDGKSWLIGKDPDAGKDWRQEEKGMTEDEMVGWHHWLKEHEFEPTLRDREGQGNLACGSPWGHKESDMTERLSNNKSLLIIFYGRIAP